MKRIFAVFVLAGAALTGPAVAQVFSALPAPPRIGLGLAAGPGTASSGLSGSVASAVPGLYSGAGGGLAARKICVVNLGVQSVGRVALIRNQVETRNLRVDCR